MGDQSIKRLFGVCGSRGLVTARAAASSQRFALQGQVFRGEEGESSGRYRGGCCVWFPRVPTPSDSFLSIDSRLSEGQQLPHVKVPSSRAPFLDSGSTLTPQEIRACCPALRSVGRPFRAPDEGSLCQSGRPPNPRSKRARRQLMSLALSQRRRKRKHERVSVRWPLLPSQS